MKRLMLSAAVVLTLAATAQAQKTGQLSNVTRLTNGTERYENPRWSPDGSKIAFTKLGYDGLLVMDANGANKKVISQGAGEGFDFKWSIDSKEILVRDTRWRDKGDGKIDRAHAIWAVSTEGKNVTREECCLSLPGLHEPVSRYEKVRLNWLDIDFVEHEEVFEGFLSRIIQHEYDHLEQTLYVDRTSPIRKQLIRSKLRNIAEGRVSCDYRVKQNAKAKR